MNRPKVAAPPAAPLPAHLLPPDGRWRTPSMSLGSLIDGGRILPMTRWGEPVMHSPTEPVTEFDDDLRALVRDMYTTMRASGGVGLAATQVGIGLAVFVFHCPDDREAYQYGAVCNPMLELPGLRERRLDVAAEGCLSLPGAFHELARPDHAICRGHDPFGRPVTVDGTGLLARCLQHETDHLSGIVFGDRLSSRARRELYRQHASLAHRYHDRWPAEPGTGPSPASRTLDTAVAAPGGTGA